MSSNKLILAAFVLAILSPFSSALLANDVEKHVMIKVDRTNDEDPIIDLEVNGMAEVFKLPELQVGETKTITTKSGSEVLVSNTEEGIKVILNGEEIELPTVDGNLGARIHRSTGLHKDFAKSVHVSGVELDDNQKQIIKDAFRAAGIDKEVNFTQDKVMVFSTDNSFTFDTDSDIDWKGKDGKHFQFMIKTDDDADVRIEKKHIIVKETKEEH